jgi:hypothetical protein
LLLWLLRFFHYCSDILNVKSCAQIEYLQPAQKSRNTDDFKQTRFFSLCRRKGPLSVQRLDVRIGEFDWAAFALRTDPACGFYNADSLVPGRFAEIAANIDARKAR